MQANASVAFEKKPQQNNHPVWQQGKQSFDAVLSYLSTNRVAFEKLSDKCAMINGECGQQVYLRFYFNEAGGMGGTPFYSVGVYKERKTSVAVVGDDGKTLLMTSQRGINGFEQRFLCYMKRLTKRGDLPQFSLG